MVYHRFLKLTAYRLMGSGTIILTYIQARHPVALRMISIKHFPFKNGVLTVLKGVGVGKERKFSLPLSPHLLSPSPKPHLFVSLFPFFSLPTLFMSNSSNCSLSLISLYLKYWGMDAEDNGWNPVKVLDRNIMRQKWYSSGVWAIQWRGVGVSNLRRGYIRIGCIGTDWLSSWWQISTWFSNDLNKALHNWFWISCSPPKITSKIEKCKIF